MSEKIAILFLLQQTCKIVGPLHSSTRMKNELDRRSTGDSNNEGASSSRVGRPCNDLYRTLTSDYPQTFAQQLNKPQEDHKDPDPGDCLTKLSFFAADETIHSTS